MLIVKMKVYKNVFIKATQNFFQSLLFHFHFHFIRNFTLYTVSVDIYLG